MLTGGGGGITTGRGGSSGGNSSFSVGSMPFGGREGGADGGWREILGGVSRGG